MRMKCAYRLQAKVGVQRVMRPMEEAQIQDDVCWPLHDIWARAGDQKRHWLSPARPQPEAAPARLYPIGLREDARSCRESISCLVEEEY